MKKLILVAFLTLGMSTFAQVEKKENEKMESRERMSPEERIQKELKRMTKVLNLTEAQQKEMSTLFSEMQSKKTEGERPSREVRKEMKDKINKILTPEQAASWAKIQDERKDKIKERRRGNLQEK